MSNAEADHVAAEAPGRVDEIGQPLAAAAAGRPSTSTRCRPTRKRGSRRARATASAAAGAATMRLAAVRMPSLMRGFDGFIDFARQPKIVGGDDEALQSAGSRRSRRKRKNSTPSRSRRCNMSGLRTISPAIAAIFGARK